MLEWKRTVCPYDCPDTCGLLVQTDGKKIYDVKADPDHPVTKGFICRKMQHYEEDIHNPERILTPLKRVGAKGDANGFEPITWEQAISIIGSKWRELMANYGPESIMPYSYAGTLGLINRGCGEAFFARLGATHLVRSICSDAKGMAAKQVMGGFSDWSHEQIPQADLIFMWSGNPMSNRLHAVPMLQEARKRGAKIILIDVHEHLSAPLADEVYLVRPGTDAVVLLSIMRELEAGDYLDIDFIRSYTTGFEALRQEYLKWTPEDAEAVSGMPADVIRYLAQLYGSAKCPIIVPGSGMSRYTNGGNAVRLLLALPALIGAWKRGGGTSCFTGSSRFFDKSMINRPDWVDPDVRRVNMNQLGEALTADDAIKSLYVYHSNPAVMTPNQNKVRQGLTREDLFLVVHDRFMTDTARYADIILPATFSVENDDIHTSYGYYHAQISRKSIQPLGESKSNWDTFRLLASEMGIDDPYFTKSADDFIRELTGPDMAIAAIPLSEQACDDLRNGLPILLDQADVMNLCHPDHRIHLAPESMAYVPLEDQTYPLRLVMAHSEWSLNSNFSYQEKLMEGRGPLRLRMNPKDACARGISQGDLCTAWNDYGEITVYAECTTQVPSGTVIAAGVYTDRYTNGDGSFSALLSEKLTDIGVASTLNTNSVDIRRKN